MWASDKIKKFGLIGTSCSGKSSLAYNILAALKAQGVSCDGVMQQDRRFAFDRVHLARCKEAQYVMICNQIVRETELTLHGHAKVLVSDNSAISLYSWYEATYGRDLSLLNMVLRWCETYTCLYYLSPLDYVDDGQRSSDIFRLKVDGVMRGLIPLENTAVLLGLRSEEILSDIMQYAKE